MSRSRRIFLLPAFALFASLLLAAPASALPAFLGSESGWARVFEPLFRLFVPEGWATEAPSGLFANEGWAIDTNGLVAPPPLNQGTQTPPHV